jgi:tRNA G26 N,N-dimethylase Trm1
LLCLLLPFHLVADMVYIILGPIWSAPMHRQDIIDELLQRVEHPTTFPPPTAKRLMALLLAMSEELKDVPLFYYLPDLVSYLAVLLNTIALNVVMTRLLPCTLKSHLLLRSTLL